MKMRFHFKMHNYFAYIPSKQFKFLVFLSGKRACIHLLVLIWLVSKFSLVSCGYWLSYLSYFLVRDIFLQECPVYKEPNQLHSAMHPEARADLAWWTGNMVEGAPSPKRKPWLLTVARKQQHGVCPRDHVGIGKEAGSEIWPGWHKRTSYCRTQ